MNESLREQLLAMETADRRMRDELLRSGELGNGYAPAMEAVHRENASRLKEIIDTHGWPDCDLVGDDGTLAAWFIAQHAIGDPEFQRQALKLIQAKVRQGKVPAAQEAYLFDRIAMYEGRPQRYGTQSLPSPDGEYRRWKTEDPEQLNNRRAAAGLLPAQTELPETEPTTQTLADYRTWVQGYEEWLRRTGWR
jgi:hypothetical protein